MIHENEEISRWVLRIFMVHEHIEEVAPSAYAHGR